MDVNGLRHILFLFIKCVLFLFFGAARFFHLARIIICIHIALLSIEMGTFYNTCINHLLCYLIL